MFCVCLSSVLSVPNSLLVTCWERVDLLALLYVIFSCVFDTFPYGVQGQLLYMIVSIPDLCLLPYFQPFVKLHDFAKSEIYIIKKHYSTLNTIQSNTYYLSNDVVEFIKLVAKKR